MTFKKDPTCPVCILHVGTNDASTRDRKRKILEIIADFKDIFKAGFDFYQKIYLKFE